jgi:hypothetical protein
MDHLPTAVALAPDVGKALSHLERRTVAHALKRGHPARCGAAAPVPHDLLFGHEGWGFQPGAVLSRMKPALSSTCKWRLTST